MGPWLWGLLLDGLSLATAFCLARRWRAGWLISLGAMVFAWPAFAITQRQWGFFPGIVAHAVVAWRGWCRWGKTT